jgi:hypothetical protein
MVVWDSRTVHWNASPVGEQTRFVTYVCYCPKSMASEEVLEGKKAVFDGRKGTTHWPVCYLNTLITTSNLVE